MKTPFLKRLWDWLWRQTDPRCQHQDIATKIDIYNGLIVPCWKCSNCGKCRVDGDNQYFDRDDPVGLCNRAADLFWEAQREYRKKIGLKY